MARPCRLVSRLVILDLSIGGPCVPVTVRAAFAARKMQVSGHSSRWCFFDVGKVQLSGQQAEDDV